MNTQVLHYAQDHYADSLERMKALLRIPSVSAQPEHEGDVRKAAEWLAADMRRIGLKDVEVVETGGHPVVYGEWLGAGADKPTLLAYGHYDVQPVDPLNEWRTPPFEPTMVGENLFARGSSDDKGQVIAILSAIEAYLKTNGQLPINFKMMVEGEEEISSRHIAGFMQSNLKRLACDAVLICDQGMLGPELPLISYGFRGMAYMEIEVKGPAFDLHSGIFGGAVDNPFNVLVHLLDRLIDPTTHHVNIPGFYDRVRKLGAEERALLAKVPTTAEDFKKLTGVPAVAGEMGYTPVEWVSVRPTLDIHGIPGGYTAAGSKTVIPARAFAKVSMRLVPDQDPLEIAKLFEDYLRSMLPPTVTLEVKTLGAAKPARVDFKAPAIQAAARAYEKGVGFSPIFMGGGGTLPILSQFIDLLKVPVALIGFGLPDDNNHSPNEKFNIPCFQKGILTVIHYLDELASLPVKK